MTRRAQSLLARYLRWGLLGLAPLAAACSQEAPTRELPATAGTVLFAVAEAPTYPGMISATGYGDYLAGLIARNQNDLTAAADFMQRALEYDPNNPALLRNTFHLVAASGDGDDTVALAKLVLVSQPEEPLANLILAIDAVNQGDLAVATARLEVVPIRGVDAILVPLLQAWILQGQGETEAAVAGLEELRQRDGIALLGHMHTALIQDVQGDSAKAEASYQAALGAGSESSLRLVRLVANFYQRNGRAEDARALYSADRPAGATTDLVGALAAEGEVAGLPDPVIANPRDGIAEVLFNLAGLLSQERAEQLALIYDHQALRLKPDFEMAQLLLGEVLERQGRDEEAIAAYRRVAAGTPYAGLARLRIADSLERLERTDQAIDELELLAEEQPENFEPLYRVGGLLRSHERFTEAVEVYDRAAARLGEPAPQHWSLLYFRGIALERSGDWERAEQDFLKALELQPDQPYVMNYLAYSWVEQKQNLQEAEDMLLRAVELRPNDGYIVDSLGWVYYRLGRYEEAAVQLERAVELHPQDPVINDHLGDAYWRVGRRQEARFQWHRALSLKPEDDEIPTIEAKIEDGLEAEPENI